MTSKLPSKVKVGPHTIKVIRKKQEGTIFGRAHPRMGWIEIAPDMSQTQEACTLVHEIIHHLIDTYRILPRMKDKEHEAIVEKMEVAMCTFIRDNPHVIQYLERSFK